MIRKLLLTTSLVLPSCCLAQKDIRITPDHININFDTTGNQLAIRGFRYEPDRPLLNFTILNTGKDDLRLADSNRYTMDPAILKAGQSGRLELYRYGTAYYTILPSFKKGEFPDKSQVVIRFIAGGKIIRRKIYFYYTYGSPKLIKIDHPVWIMDSLVAHKFREAQANYPDVTYENFRFTMDVELRVDNISKIHLNIPQSAISFNDWGGRLSFREEKNKWLSPGKHDVIPVTLAMDSKKYFTVSNWLMVHTPDYTNIDFIFIRLSSKFHPGLNGSPEENRQ